MRTWIIYKNIIYKFISFLLVLRIFYTYLLTCSTWSSCRWWSVDTLTEVVNNSFNRYKLFHGEKYYFTSCKSTDMEFLARLFFHFQMIYLKFTNLTNFIFYSVRLTGLLFKKLFSVNSLSNSFTHPTIHFYASHIFLCLLHFYSFIFTTVKSQNIRTFDR